MKGKLVLRDKVWYVRLKIKEKYVYKSTHISIENKQIAEEVLEKIQNQLTSIENLQSSHNNFSTLPKNLSKILTFSSYSQYWIEERKEKRCDWKNEESRLKHHLLPYLSHFLLHEIKPRHLISLIQTLRKKDLSPKTIKHIYSILTTMFKDGIRQEIITTSPCVLTKSDFPKLQDKNPSWRMTAIFTKEEVIKLITDERIPKDRKVFYSIGIFTGGRSGEISGLRWKHIDFDMKPLGRITIETSYDNQKTKTGITRFIPIHPTLQTILLEWKQKGWKEIFGKTPQHDDLVIPMTKCLRIKQGEMRTAERVWRRFKEDLETLGLRHRRFHDIRRSFITFLRQDFGNKDIIKYFTHTPPTRDVLDLYTTFSTETFCNEMNKLKISLP